MNLNDPIFTDETKAREYFEGIRWPDGPYCPHCGEAKRVYRLEGKSHRPGLFHCNSCNGQFTVTTGSVMESSHLPLTKWAMGFRLYAGSKKGFSANQLHRSLGITYKSAWFMAHRIREAMGETNPGPLGGKDKVVEVDETFIGKPKPVFINGRGWVTTDSWHTKQKVISLVERGGRSRSIKVDDLSRATVRKTLTENMTADTTMHTDEARFYRPIGREYAKHEAVNHSAKEYGRGKGKDLVTTNTVEGFFSIFKRGMRGVYQHCNERHLQAYLNEFDFRYSNREKLGVDDVERTKLAIMGAEGKRLTYRQAD